MGKPGVYVMAARRWSVRSPSTANPTANPTAIAACRIAVTAALLVSPLFRADYRGLLRAASDSQYAPIGVLCWLWQRSPPSALLIDGVQTVALVSTTMSLIGLATAPMMILSFLSSWFLASLSFSYSAAWSHEYNVILLVQLALLAAPCGRALSIDALRSERSRQRPLSIADCNVPVFAAQFMVAWMFFNAFCYKLLLGGMRWWNSDNLRNTLSIQWLALGKVTPPLVQFVADHVVLYKAAAAASLMAQGSMILSLVFFHWPFRRAFFGLGFFFETLGLSVMMSRWDDIPINGHWLLLYAVFIDWNWLLPGQAERDCQRTPLPRRPRLRGLSIATAWALFAVTSEFVASLATPGRNVRAAYPFSAFPMYSRLYGQSRLKTHASFEFIGPQFVSNTVDLSLGTRAARLVYPLAGNLVEDANLGYVRGRLIEAQRLLAARPEVPPAAITLLEAIYRIPPYPGSARRTIEIEGIRGIVASSGAFAGFSARIATNGDDRIVHIDAEHLDIGGGATLVAIPVDFRGERTFGRVHSKSIYSVGAPFIPRGTWDGSNFHTHELPRGAYIVALRATPTLSAKPNEPLLFFAGPIVEFK